MTEISIIIPTKNSGKTIDKCLDSIYQQDTLDNFEVIIIDSGSKDNTLDIIRSYDQVKLFQIKPEAFGHGKTRNMGAEKAKGKFLVFLNADAIPENNQWLNQLIQPFTENHQIAGVFSRHLPQKECHLFMVRDLLKAMPDESLIRSKPGLTNLSYFSTVSGALKKEIWLKIPFENDIVIAEDQKWARAANSMGYQIAYQPLSRVIHSHNYGLRELFEIKRQVGIVCSPFQNRFYAATFGFGLVLAGAVLKILFDVIFILFKQTITTSLRGKIKEIKYSILFRVFSFWGKYLGWIGKF